MTGFIVRRFLRGLLTLWVVVTLVFFGLRIQGDPVLLLLGDEASPEAVEAMREKLGLDDPVAVQYIRYLQAVSRGEFGNSIRERRPVSEAVFDRVPATLQLAGAALALSVVIGVPIGVLAARRRNTLTDRALMGVAFFGQSAPDFFIGILLILIFSLWLTVLPSGGRGGLEHLIMPAFAASFAGIARLARLTRSSVLEVMSEDFVRTARAKGLAEQRVMASHVLRNAAIPVITVFGISLGLAIAGSVVVETVFAWPGVGRLATNSVLQRDYPVIQFIVMLIAATVVTANFLIDVLYGLIDPRIRQG